MSQRVAGKTALVVGAGSVGEGWGNGKAAAVLLAREGAHVFCVDINQPAAEETANIIRSEGGQAEAMCADASRPDEVKRAVDACVERFGTIDLLDNNVGIVEVGGVVDVAPDLWDLVMSVNLKSCFLSMKYVIPVMASSGGGSIVNISSIASIRYTGVPYATYNASKAAMNHLTRSTAAQYAADQIRVNAVLPGLMKTPMVQHSAGLAAAYGSGDVDAMWRAREEQVPMGTAGDAWDVAHAVLFLSSDEARYITGIEMVVDGGLTLKCS
jgi:NAD(P)-dependent dehydrogenase (short-subunit alcohol dehydrogenase family)